MENTITLEKKSHVLLIGLNRPDENNLFNQEMIFDLAAALGELERDPDLRCGVMFAHGKHFTLGLDLAEVGPSIAKGELYQYPETSIDPWQIKEPFRTKPLICAIHGLCLTLGIELALASDIRLAARETRFSQLEVKRGIYPFGGATSRFVHEAGWGTAMRYMLTGDEFSSEEAFRFGMIQEVVEKDELLPRAIELAEKVSRQAPLGTQATIKMARLALLENEKAANQKIWQTVLNLLQTEDAKEGAVSFLERRHAVFKGR
ncbi:crotonase/enoyl-CoA hydratase family protein [Bacillus changyiensis]|uniref:crotonase/enoyl-CoA hydratase family protein n=1 Tax=Bacillus changyiensis TaxID=3004103 RepID=UPI0022E3F0EB|nr:crotonase/enoyl-CoA hydratase family protein [Bacillus changyiensis]MDA1476754.1 crotonase/enoyl-CoA hydratase family protein [Bacillus changyiensis]